MDRQRRPAGGLRAVVGAADAVLPAGRHHPLRVRCRRHRAPRWSDDVRGGVLADDAHRQTSRRTPDPAMTPASWGVVLGAFVGFGVWLVVDRLVAHRHTSLAIRVAPYLRDLPATTAIRRPPAEPTTAFRALFGPFLSQAAELVERILGGSASVRRRIERARLPMTVHEFRISQAVWGLVAFFAAAVPSAAIALQSPARSVPLLVMCGCAFALGVLLRENRLTAQVTQRERRILAEFPTIAELLALAVAAGESPVAALDRVVQRSHGELSADL